MWGTSFKTSMDYEILTDYFCKHAIKDNKNESFYTRLSWGRRLKCKTGSIKYQLQYKADPQHLLFGVSCQQRIICREMKRLETIIWVREGY